MIDPLISLAFAAYSNSGVYALLLGSGVSRAAQIPTGWEVTLDLIRKIALLENANCEPDPAIWWKNRTGQVPDYSKMLDELAKSAVERQQLLRTYFEPTEPERAEGIKSPTAAHRAIAKLVQRGVVRVIITTNFDRLVERALDEVGITPTVISTADGMAGALPLVHSGITVVKVNGDYLDSRIRNTEAELSKYESGLNDLLDQIFDEYGLITCGWSADWDSALSAAINRSKSRRFTTYWASRGDPSPKARSLIQTRRAQIISITSAENFFVSLEEKVRGLSDSDAPHPLSAKVMASVAKRHLGDPTGLIRLHDLTVGEVEHVYALLNGTGFSFESNARLVVEAHPAFVARLEKYEATTESLCSLLVTGSYWGNELQRGLWVNALERIANHNEIGSGADWLLNLRLYPALLLHYAAVIAAIAAGKYGTVKALLERPVRRSNNREKPLMLALDPYEIIEADFARLLPGMEKRFTPVNDYLHAKLRGPLREYLSQDAQYEAAFDQSEYLRALVWMDITLQAKESPWAPVGRFAWKGRNLPGQRMLSILESEIDSAGGTWPPLAAGMFAGDSTRLVKAKVALRELISEMRFH
jgi:hypothetical protein